MAKPSFGFKDLTIWVGSESEVTSEAARIVTFEIPGGVTTPQEFAEAVRGIQPELAGEFGVIFDGRGPVWGFAILVHEAHPTRFVATRDPRLGAVVVESHVPGLKAGDVIPFPEA